MTINVHDFAQSYEFRADDGDHTPNDAERALIEDAIHGYLDALAAINPPSAAPGEVEP